VLQVPSPQTVKWLIMEWTTGVLFPTADTGLGRHCTVVRILKLLLAAAAVPILGIAVHNDGKRIHMKWVEIKMSFQDRICTSFENCCCNQSVWFPCNYKTCVTQLRIKWEEFWSGDVVVLGGGEMQCHRALGPDALRWYVYIGKYRAETTASKLRVSDSLEFALQSI
jgi:hypothetical protein